MQSITATGYTIHFGAFGYESVNTFLDNNKYSALYIIVDSHTNENCLPLFLQHIATELAIEIIEIEPGEETKSIDTCVEVWKALTDLGADRKSLLINLGGGVVSDLGGFVASTYKRGIEFIHVPTTLLGMVDAAVGGKNGVDLGNLKNQIGVINPPKMVIIDTLFLETLPQNEMRSGLAEMLKHGLIYDKSYWEHFLDLSKIDYTDFDALIYRSVEIKNEIVQQDPKEAGIRKALNFGHTIGHAIESYFLENVNKTTLLHGEAVAAGMVLEAHMSMAKGMLTTDEYNDIKMAIIGIFGTINFDDADLEPILDLMVHDKKNEYGNIRFVLLDGIGKVLVNQDVDNEQIIAAFADYKS
ncbi:MAG TPA: 3-dehydroquinate synthase [Flavobacterium sp.]|nr:3-dehydroquinate synthase [Flavobacterium sp.]